VSKCFPVGNHPWLGSLLIAASATAYSTAGFFTRLIDLDIWTVLFWRGLFAGLFIADYVIWENGRETAAAVRAIGARGLWIAFFSTFATICFLNALRLTTVAEVAVINATSPFITGALAWLFLGERERWPTVDRHTVFTDKRIANPVGARMGLARLR